uniref:Hbs1-like protein n=1 Tax=Triatoma infestans TaxID=30076 RepID=A0A161M408_TRIIF
MKELIYQLTQLLLSLYLVRLRAM